jgi:hypothetical protein
MDRPFDVEQESWRNVMRAVTKAARRVKDSGRRCVYCNALIVAMYLWSVMHSRSLSWACQRSHYGAWFRPRKLPSISQFTRRIGGETCQQILQTVHEELAGLAQPIDGGHFDGKPLPTSPVSKDPDAHRGHITGGFAKGYKLHAFVTRRRRIVVWSVMPLNVAEQSVALEMMPYLPPMLPQSLNLADSNYDSAPLHKAHTALGTALFTPLKGQKRVKNGQHHEVTLRQMGEARRQAVQVWQEHPDLGRFVLKERNNVEGTFSVLTVALDLRLPPSVRRLVRVRRFVGAKIILYHARLLAQEQAAA